LSVILLMVVSILVIGSPLYFLVSKLTENVGLAIENKAEIQKSIVLALGKIEDTLGVDFMSQINFSDITSFGIKMIQQIINTSVNGLLQLGVAYLILYFMLMNYRKMENWLYDNIPLKTENLVILNKDLRDLVISNAVGVPVVAILQSIVAFIGYLIFGLESAFTWFVLTIFAAMVPVLGAALTYVPASIYLIAPGETTNGYLLLIYSSILVGASDNIFRFWINKVIADVHPLITIFGVVLGINVFGLIGIIFGPILLSLVIWMFRIYTLEFSRKSKNDSKIKSEIL